MDKLIFKISHLLESPTGNSEIYSFDVPLDLEFVEKKGNVTGKIEIMRIDEGLNVVAKDVELNLKTNCAKCLKAFSQKIKITSAERQFELNPPEKAEDENDVYLINKKNLTIDVTEMLRQEIILHFPVISVCSSGCKGLCPYCGKNKNLAKCTCSEPIEADFEGNKPLKALKEFFNKK
ncbi:DUF177 domain-containing protein [Candidatus Gracilibacteria bacterium]|jgi:uncharacterized protein|nr:DUF177 domain-containing protein [Candidatus Gracilibacteria bacterium]